MPFPQLTAVGTERLIDVSSLAAPLVCICFAQATQDGAEPAEGAVRQRFPSASQVLIAHVVDLHTVPSMFRGVARGILASEYAKAVASLPGGQTPYDDVVILPDWDGAFVAALGFDEDVSKRLGLAVFDADGRLLGTAQGDGAASRAIELLQG